MGLAVGDAAGDGGAHARGVTGVHAVQVEGEVEAAGAVYVARWTTFHVRQMARAMEEMFTKKGFCFLEVISPCPTLYQRRNKMGDGLALSKTGDIIVGKFVDRERADYRDLMHDRMHETLGDRYVEREACECEI